MARGTIAEPFTISEWAEFCGTPVEVSDYVVSMCVLKGWLDIYGANEQGQLLFERRKELKVIHPIRIWRIE